uniref:Uncharacterized protein n=1 Tax=Timema monikensis TaxID=170555 RepID=A0A7R9E1S3_9NEOP|nr:unnamed protein product [Timema monikensis]
MASLVLTDSSQLTSDSQHLAPKSNGRARMFAPPPPLPPLASIVASHTRLLICEVAPSRENKHIQERTIIGTYIDRPPPPNPSPAVSYITATRFGGCKVGVRIPLLYSPLHEASNNNLASSQRLTVMKGYASFCVKLPLTGTYPTLRRWNSRAEIYKHQKPTILHTLSTKNSFHHHARAGTARATVLSLPGSPAFLPTPLLCAHAHNTLRRWHCEAHSFIQICFYGRVQSVKLLPRREEEGSTGLCATVAFMDIKSAAKAHNMEHKLDERCLSTEYYEPAAIPGGSAASLYVGPRFPHGSPMTSLVLTDSSQLRADGFEKLPDQIMYPYAEPYHAVFILDRVVVILHKFLATYQKVPGSIPGASRLFFVAVGLERAQLSFVRTNYERNEWKRSGSATQASFSSGSILGWSGISVCLRRGNAVARSGVTWEAAYVRFPPLPK